MATRQEKAFVTEILSEVREQIMHKSSLINNMRSLKLAAYSDAIAIIEDKTKEINKDSA